MKTTVVFLVFNRPELTSQVLARIRDARPEKLVVVADGPRADRPEDVVKCQRVRELIDAAIDWPCDVVRDYADQNLGCGRRVASGISNAFNLVDEAIILEDDCLPDPSFFPFCEALLARYRDDQSVAVISGSNRQHRGPLHQNSYYFSRYNHVWGWASWRRAWQCYDFQMKSWPKFREQGLLRRLFADAAVRRYWQFEMNKTYRREIDTWDVQWTFACWCRDLKSILPAEPLVENIGFGSDATHTVAPQKTMRAVKPVVFPLRHPQDNDIDSEADAHSGKMIFSREPLWQRTLTKVARRSRRMLWI